MRTAKEILKKMLFLLFGLFGLLVITGTLFLKLSPQFGRAPSDEQKAEYERSTDHHNGKKFVNQIPSEMNIEFFTMIRDLLSNDPSRSPRFPPVPQKLDSLEIVDQSIDMTRLTWFGHSAFLLEMDGKKILLDPMMGDCPAPHPWLGTKRYNTELPIEIEKLPFIDLVIISHDHYDHLDYGSIQQLKHKVKHFYVPLGVENHLISWGVPERSISVLDWWEETKTMGIELICAPARHFSGRGLTDRASTLWCSWIIKGKNSKIYFSGDSGYGPHFKEIGTKYGPFDIALMECGQYNQQWEAIHMMPEQTAQAGIEVRADLIMPIHWGAFTLALHSWTDPVERLLEKAKELNIPVATPVVGEPIFVGDTSYPISAWWEEY